MEPKKLSESDIMRMPDCWFGQRYPVSVGVYAEQAGISYALSNLPLPDMCMIWSITCIFARVSGALCYFSLKMGDYLPTTDAEFDALPDLLQGWGWEIGGRDSCLLREEMAPYVINMKKLVKPQGLRLAARFNMVGTAYGTAILTAVVSSVPKDLPIWES